MLRNGRVGLVRGHSLKIKYWNWIFRDGVVWNKENVKKCLPEVEVEVTGVQDAELLRSLGC